MPSLRARIASVRPKRFPHCLCRRVCLLPAKTKMVCLAFLTVALITLLPGCKSEHTVDDFPRVKISIDGNAVESDVPAVEIDGTVFIPAQTMNEILSGCVMVDSSGKVSVSTNEYNLLRLEIAKTKALLKKAEEAQEDFIQGVSLTTLPKGVTLRNPYIMSCSDLSEMLTVQLGFNVRGGTGGRMSYILRGLADYIGAARGCDSILLINSDYEPLHALKDWPREWSDILPFSYEEVAALEPPFAWIRRDSRGFLRAIIVVNGSGNVKPVVDLMASGAVPLDMPLTPKVTLSAVTPRLSDKAAAEIVTVKNEHFEVEVLDRAYANDGSLFLTWASEAVAGLQSVFTDALVKVPLVKVTLSAPSAQLPLGSANSSSVVDPPSMRFILPTLAQKESPNYDRVWYVGTIAHEFMHCLHARYSAETGTPLHSREIPKWFAEGVGEYGCYIVMGKAEYDRRYGSHRALAAKHIIEQGLSRVNVYDAGAWALRYMDEIYGREKIISLMKSKEPLFRDAMKAELGVTVEEFEEGLKEWLSKR